MAHDHKDSDNSPTASAPLPEDNGEATSQIASEHSQIGHYCGAAAIGIKPRTDAGPTLHYSDHQVEIHRVVVGELDNNVFVVRCKHTGDSVLIDAANEHDRLLELAQSLGVRQVIETHGHWDHIGAVEAMRDNGYNVWVTEEDASMLPTYDQIIEDEHVFEVGDFRLRSIKTPGHTAGSVSFEIVGSPVLFSGDTLFPGGPGTCQFGGHFPTIIDTLDRKFFSAFDPETIVMPGHGNDTLIRLESPHLDEWAERGW